MFTEWKLVLIGQPASVAKVSPYSIYGFEGKKKTQIPIRKWPVTYKSMRYVIISVLFINMHEIYNYHYSKRSNLLIFLFDSFIFFLYIFVIVNNLSNVIVYYWMKNDGRCAEPSWGQNDDNVLYTYVISDSVYVLISCWIARTRARGGIFEKWKTKRLIIM